MKLGLIENNSPRGGKDYLLFRETIRRLSRVIYENTGFYDPIRGEHRDVDFGFLEYRLPVDPKSSRTWRVVWDQQFFEVCQAAGGSPMPLTLHPNIVSRKALAAGFWRENAASLHRRLAPCRSE